MTEQSKSEIKAFEHDLDYRDRKVRFNGPTKLEGFVREIEREEGQTYLYVKLPGQNTLVRVRKNGVKIIECP